MLALELDIFLCFWGLMIMVEKFESRFEKEEFEMKKYGINK